jgi:hypothetical protein
MPVLIKVKASLILERFRKSGNRFSGRKRGHQESASGKVGTGFPTRSAISEKALPEKWEVMAKPCK